MQKKPEESETQVCINSKYFSLCLDVVYHDEGISSWSRIFCGVREMDRGRQRQTAIMTHKLFFWPYHAVLSWRPHLHFFCFSAWDTQLEACCEPLPQWGTLSGYKLILTQDSHWLQPSCGHLHISFHNAHDFWSTTWLLPLIYKGTPCSEKSLTAQSRVSMQHWLLDHNSEFWINVFPFLVGRV